MQSIDKWSVPVSAWMAEVMQGRHTLGHIVE